jgi:peroxiredoxin
MHDTRDDLLIIGIAEDEHASDAREMIQRYRLTFPVVHDASNVLAGRFRVRELPVTFLIDKNGVVRFVAGPNHDEQDLVRAIRSLE